MLKDYLVQNWSLVLILTGFAIALEETIFLDKKTIRRLFILIVSIFVLSVVVFVEFYFDDLGLYPVLRTYLMAIRYSATPFIIALVMFSLVKKSRWFIFIPAIVLAIIDIISIYTGIVFSIDENNVFVRGPLGYLPFIVAGLYCVALIYLLFSRSNKKAMETIPIVFLTIALASGVFFPFFLGKDYAKIFCTTIAVALFVYYLFSLLQLTKNDSLTGLLNRQAFYSDISKDVSEIKAIVSIDMNGLKKINDNYGHAAGDEALTTLALCFKKALKRNQEGYRIGGDEFIIICRNNNLEEVDSLVVRIRENVKKTIYSCSVGYSYKSDDEKDIDTLIAESDVMMYEEKAKYYESHKK